MIPPCSLLPSALFRCVLVAVTLACAPARRAAAPRQPAPYAPTPSELAFLDTLQRRTFDFFWETTDARTGPAHDRWPARSFSSVAAVGFALTAYPVGVERGYVARAAARDGPILAMVENYRSGLVWRYMRRSPHVVRGLCRAGFEGGWLAGRCAAAR